MPLSSAWQPSSSTYEEGSFSVTARGGPSRINLNWESLISASVHLGEAVTVMNEQRTHLIDADRASLPAPVWRCVGFQTRLLLLCSAVTTGQWSMEQTLIGVEAAHEAYREAESSAQRWIDQLTRGSLPAQLWGRLQGGGSDEYDSDRLASSVIQETYGVREAAALFGGFIPMGRQAHTAAMQAEGTLRIAGAGAGRWTEDLMRRNRLVVQGAEELPQVAYTGPLSNYLESVEGAAESGNIVISTVDKGQEDDVYVVHLPGLDPEAVTPGSADRSSGRGALTTTDAFFNDADRLGDAVLEALRQQGAPAGASVVLTGHSQGGLAAVKLADGSSAVSQKYSVKHTATVAAPAVSGHISSQSPISHFLDEKDPVPKLGGGFNGVSSDRHEYRYDYRRPEEAAEDSDSGPLDFLSHDYGHNVEGIRSTESDPHGELSDEDRLNLDELEALLRGSASVTAYDTGWEPVP